MMASWYHFGLAQIILAMTSIIHVQAETSFSFLTFPTAERFLVLNDTEHSPRNSSFLLNLNAEKMEPSCGRLLYNQKIRMKNATSGALGSFHTAFTFQISGPNKHFVAAPVFYHGDGLAFTFVRAPVLMDPVVSGSGMCLITGAMSPSFFAVEFDTYRTAAYDDSSDSHVGVNLDSMNSTWSYNLCEDKEHCSYLCNGGYFTAWVDYYSKSQILRVFLARGSLRDSISKPRHPLIDAEVSAQIANLVDEFMYVGFSSSTGLHREVHEIKSWTFTSSMTEHATAPPSSPSSPASSPSSPRPAVSSPGSRSRKFIIVGSCIAAGVLILIVCFSCYRKLSSGSNPLRIFISHTGGPTGGEKNFAIRLYDELKASAKMSKLKYEVFIDREMPKGTHFPSTLFAQIANTDMAIVVISKDYFKRKWPMIELTKFVEMHRNPPGLVHKVLPLFYKLTVTEVRSRLEYGYWEPEWTEMSSAGDYPIPLEKCKEAVRTLCVQNGVNYSYRSEGHEADYVKMIVGEVKKIYKQWTYSKLKRQKVPLVEHSILHA